MRALAMTVPKVEIEVVNVHIDFAVYRHFGSQKNKRKLFVKYKDKKVIKSRLFQITTPDKLSLKEMFFFSFFFFLLTIMTLYFNL